MNKNSMNYKTGLFRTVKKVMGFFLVLSAVLFFSVLPIFRKAAAESEITVALYPYVPDLAEFERSVEAEWTELHPDVKLKFVSWDCYGQDPSDDLDVFVYDSIFLYDFLEKGNLLPLEEEDIRNADDFVPAAFSACQADGFSYALPQLLCTNLLYYREGDKELAEVNNIHELYDVIGASTRTYVPPEKDDDLLISIPDTLSLAFWYLEVQTDLEQNWSEWNSLPEEEGLDSDIMETLCKIQKMAGVDQMVYVSPDNDPYVCGSWFAEGYGRGLIGFSEAMSAMGDDAAGVAFRRISLSDSEDIPMLFADIASINAKISEEKKPLAIDLLNLITGKEVLEASFTPDSKDQYPQYLLSARMSVYDVLSEQYPIYGNLKAVVSDPECRVFLSRAGGREFADQAKRIFQIPLPEVPVSEPETAVP